MEKDTFNQIQFSLRYFPDDPNDILIKFESGEGSLAMNLSKDDLLKFQETFNNVVSQYLEKTGSLVTNG